MQAIVLAAGEGSRMRPLTSSRPKVMLPAGGKPFLEHMVKRASNAGITEFIFVVGYRLESITERFEDGSDFGTKIEYVVQKEQLGTGHALMVAEEMAKDRFLVLNGDVLTDESSLKWMVGTDGLAVAAKRVPDPSRYGVFEVERGELKSVKEKSRSPPSDLANAGIYLLNEKIFDVLRDVPVSERGEYELTDGLNALVSRGEEIRVAEIEEWIEIGRPWDLLNANEKLLSSEQYSVLGDVEPNATLSGRVSVGVGTRIRSGSYIEGPVVIGENCDIGPNCFIRPYTCIGDNVRIGNAVEIKNSTIMENTNVAHLSYVGDSVIGSNCNFGAGTIVANLRHDRGDIQSYIRGEWVKTARHKLGVIMGDDVKTGINTSIYPGTVIGSGYRSEPGEVLRGRVTTERRK
ncbi:MAG: bifunctional sugar-1-phosphate nucleotidylyltransferase/acetyltransferase [Methanothrix sp.]|jgi:bifunctional UDP-N-acetylglucosamine pyrophosphorylase/glucosamine-1-phosphate N-acetyltransferase|uniref:Bifunctional protein GlmU n=1 Tax=Methanothrix harundinacea TaxID=301375 RepID=A0A117LG69_9EURY|nr:MAG: glucose-1-phosphate thymidylyltransferase [Methanosaeta sp. SDB]KUK45400.1 MAG: Nucleotidyl transferase [Methanothrix harundinacea]MDD3708989.1 sugar phosphate nucleotidyltransferase [Methanothrix sp.]MDI9398206.1 sugar phosphate nucleotidyltransferase [Euryarchaeota archaeon]KUK97149.1 MAG: Nucleotidyl transferase [Methanothrix harundinacea]